MIICPACNTEHDPEDRFCSNCGSAIEFSNITELPQPTDDEPNFVDLATDRTYDTFVPALTAASIELGNGQPNSPIFPVDIFEDGDVSALNDDESRGKNLWLIGGVIAAILLIGMLYYWLFISDDIAPPSGTTSSVAAKTVDPAIPAVAMFAVTQANIRNRASTNGSQIMGKLSRSDAATGRLALGEDGTSNWLELSDGRGFVSAINLSDTAPPPLVKTLNALIWTADEAVNILAQPHSNGPVLLRVSVGTKLPFVGITANDAELLSESEVIAPAIAIKFNAAACGYGNELDGQFQKLFTKAQSDARAIEDADYPDAEMRNRALATIAGKSHYQRLERSFNGLTITGIGQHYESTSIYFADKPDKVTATFKSLGYRVGANGLFPEQESTGAGIGATTGEAAAYGRSDLSCGA
jgi:hypothetical protein